LPRYRPAAAGFDIAAAPLKKQRDAITVAAAFIITCPSIEPEFINLQSLGFSNAL